MSDLVVKYDFEPTSVNGLEVNNSSYGAKILTAIQSSSNMITTSRYIQGSQALSLSGSNFLTLPDITDLGTSITLTLWVYNNPINTLDVTPKRIMEIRSTTLRYYITIEGSNLYFGLNSFRYLFNIPLLTAYYWHFIAWVITPTNWQMYVNTSVNMLNYSSAFSGSILGSSSFLGKGSSDNSLIGNIDDFRIYKVPLSSDQIFDIYDRATVALYYRFEQEDISLNSTGTYLLANLSSGMPVYDASIVRVSNVSQTFGTSQYNINSSIFKSGNSSLYNSGISGNHILLPPILNANPQGITISMWFYVTSTANQTLCSVGDGLIQWMIHYYGSNSSVGFSNYFMFTPTLINNRGEAKTDSAYPNGNNIGNTQLPLSLRMNLNMNSNTWHHITWTIAPKYWKIQIDGSNNFIHSSAILSTGNSLENALFSIPSYMSNNRLLSSNFNIYSNFGGYIDDFRLYNRVLSDNETLKLYTHKCLRTNYYTSNGYDLINVYQPGSSNLNIGFETETNDNLDSIFGSYNISLSTPQLVVNANLSTSTELYLHETMSNDLNSTKTIDRIQIGQIVSSSVISGNPYVVNIDKNTNKITLNKSAGTPQGNIGTGYSDYFYVSNGILYLLYDSINKRTYGGDSPASGQLVFYNNVPIAYIKNVYETPFINNSVPILTNGSFNIPSIRINSFLAISSPYSAISNWNISTTTCNIFIANNSSFWGFPTLPTGISQWLIVQSTGLNSNASLIYNIPFNEVGNYTLSFSSYVKQTDNNNLNTISANINGYVINSYYPGNSDWSTQSLSFISIPGNNTLIININFGAGNESAFYLTNLSITSTNTYTITNANSYNPYSISLSNTLINIPLNNGMDIYWRNATPTSFYTPNEFRGSSGYLLLSGLSNYDDYNYKFTSLSNTNIPFISTGTYNIINHSNGYYTISYSDYGTITFVEDVSNIQLLVVGSGGAGGKSTLSSYNLFLYQIGGGGGEGGQVIYYSNYYVIPYNTYIIDIGAGGKSSSTSNVGSDGSPCRFGNEIAYGGKSGAAGSLNTSNGVITAGTGGSSSLNGGNGGNGSNIQTGSGSVGSDGVSITFGTQNTIVYGGGGAGGNNGSLNTLVNGGNGGGGSNGVNGVDGLGGGGGGSNGNSGIIGNGGKGCVQIYVGAPPDPPSSLTATSKTNNTINVSFKPPRRTVNQYTISITNVSGGSTISYNFSTGTEYLITGLTQDTSYSIFVTASNAVGSSLSNIIIVNTLKTQPNMPDIRYVYANTNNAQFTLGNANTDISQYVGYAMPFFQSQTQTPQSYISSLNVLNLNNLSSDTFYILYAYVNTNYGRSDTNNAFFKTKSAPPSISSFALLSRESDSFTISFNRPSENYLGESPLLYYTFDTFTYSGNNIGNISSGALIYDASLSTGTINTIITKTGSGSLTNNTNNGYPMKINTDINFDTITTFTICFWIYPQRYYVGNLFGATLWLASFSSVTQNNQTLIYGVRFTFSGTLSIYSGDRVYNLQGYINQSTWTHVTIVQNVNTFNTTGTLLLYLNGVLTNTNTTINMYQTNMYSTQNYIGYMDEGFSFYDGYIDDFRFYQTGLNTTQINSIINNTFSVTSPITYYKIYYHSIAFLNTTSLSCFYRTHPMYIKNGLLINISPDKMIYDASLNGYPYLGENNSYYECILNANLYQYIYLPPININNSGFTFMCSFRSNTSLSNSVLLEMSTYSQSSPITKGIGLYILSNQLYYTINNYSTQTRISTTDINNNTNIHLVFVVSANSSNLCQITVYYNNVSVYTALNIPYPENGIRDLCFIGKGNQPSMNYINGAISDIFIWNRAISSAEVNRYYNNKGFTNSSNAIVDASQIVNYTLSGLQSRNTYCSLIATVNQDNESYSNPIYLSTLNVADPPSNVVISNITNISATFSFTPPDQPVNYYKLVLKTLDISTNIYTTTHDISFSNTTYTVNTLVKNTTYYVFLYSVNNDGISIPEQTNFITLKEPDSPTNLNINAISSTYIIIQFTSATGYNVTNYDVSAIPQLSGVTVFASFSSALTTYRLNGLIAGTEYTLYLSARNIFGNSPSATASFMTTFVADPPSDFATTTITDTNISITFTPPSQIVNYYKLFVTPTIPNAFKNFSFTNYTSLSQPSDILNMTLSSPANTRIAVFASDSGIKYRLIVGGVWGEIITPILNFNISPSTIASTSCCVSSDGSVLVASFGLSRIYWADSTGILNGYTNRLYFNSILDDVPRLCYGLALTANKSRLVVSEYGGFIYYSEWNGTNYGVLNKTYETNLRNYFGVDVSVDGNKIVYSGNNKVYWSAWNGTNYIPGTEIVGNINGTRALSVCFVKKDPDLIAISSYNGQPQYTAWNGTNYNSFTNIPSPSLPSNISYSITSDISGVIYLSPYNSAFVYLTNVHYLKYSQTIDMSFTNIPYTISNLVKNTQYDLSLSAVNNYGESLHAILQSISTKNNPDAITVLRYAAKNTTVDISYCKPIQPVTSYLVQINSGGLVYLQTFSNISVKITGLSPGISYNGLVDAINNDGNSPDVSFSFSTTTIPSPPNTPIIIAKTSTTIDVSFSLPEYDLSSLYFNGSSNIFTASSASSFSLSTGTIECWMCTDVSNTSTYAIVVKSNAYGIYTNNNKIGIYNWVTNTWSYISPFNINDNRWHHIAFAFQNGVNNGSQVYYDGVQIATVTHTVVNQSSIFSVGGLNGQMFRGNICEVRVWNVVRSPSNIYDYYNKKLPFSNSNLIGYFPMNDGGSNITYNAVQSSSITQLNLSGIAVWVNKQIDIIDLSYVSFNITSTDLSNSIVITTISPSSRYAKISGLQPNTTYNLTMTSTNSYGTSPLTSIPLSVNTHASGFSPLSFAVDTISDVSLSYLFYRPVNNPTSYNVVAIPIFGGTRITSSITSSSTLITGTLNGLNPSTQYLVYSIISTTDAIPSNTVQITTLASPLVISLASYTNTTATLLITPPTYYVSYYVATFKNNWGGSDVVSTFTSTNPTISGLVTSNLYAITVIAYTPYTSSIPSNSVSFFTEGITTPPQNLSVTTWGDTSANITFNTPQYGNVTSYTATATSNDIYVSSLTSTNFVTALSNQRSDNVGMAITSPGATRLALFSNLTNMSFSRIVNGVWGAYTTLTVSGIATPIDYLGCAITKDGTRCVIIHGTLGGTDALVYWGNTTNILNGSSTTLSLSQTLETTQRRYCAIAMTNDGSRIVVTVGEGLVYFATWNGTNYSTFTSTSDTSLTRSYQCIAITSIGDRIAYCADRNIFWASWNGTTYINERNVIGTQTGNSRSIAFLGDASNVLIYGGSSVAATYLIWNGVNYVFNNTSFPTTSIPANDNWALVTDSSNVVYVAPYSNTNVIYSNITINYAARHQVIQSFSGVTSYVINGLQSYQTYDISLVAVNSYGSSSPVFTSVTCGGFLNGTLVNNGSYTLYRFTQNGTITIPGARSVYYVILAGGGNGPNHSTAFWSLDAPGAGAGGIRSGIINQTSTTNYIIDVGLGGVAAGFSRVQNAGNQSRIYFGSSVILANGGKSSASGASGGAAGATLKGLSGIANVTESGTPTNGSNANVGFPGVSYSISIGTVSYNLGGGGAGANSSTGGQTSTYGGGGGGQTGVVPVSGAANTGGGGGGHFATTSSTGLRNQTASGGSGVVLLFYS